MSASSPTNRAGRRKFRSRSTRAPVAGGPYVSGLLIDMRVVALLGFRTRRDLISGKVHKDRMGRQILGA